MPDSLSPLTRTTATTAPARPLRILQFGEGNFLRAFSDWMIQEMNEKTAFSSDVALVQPIPQGRVSELMAQDGLYHLYLRGIKGGEAVEEKQLIEVIRQGINPYEDYQAYLDLAAQPDLKFVISNTTEAGISYLAEGKPAGNTPPQSFPAKVCALLHHRYQQLGGTTESGLIFLPCELIEENGNKLREIVLQLAGEWGLEPPFSTWVSEHNIFCNTLVDRIVPGYPAAEIDDMQQDLGFSDHSIVVGESFHLWVIEGPESVQQQFPADQAGLNVVFTPNQLHRYRTRKVRILNGAHTLMVPTGLLYGLEAVRESIEDEVFGSFIQKAINEEIIPTLDLPKEELDQFAADVLDRFRNPFIRHELASIALNSVAKFTTRVLPSLLTYQHEKQALPYRLTLGLASLIYFYGGAYRGNPLPVKDSAEIRDFFSQNWRRYRKEILTLDEMVEEILGQTDYWGMDLNGVPELTDLVTEALTEILHGHFPDMIQDLS